MDFLDPKKRKAQRIKLLIGYGLVAIALTIATIVLFYQSDGYNRDPKTGEIVRNGLIFIDSTPGGAAITLNGEQRGLTDQRLDVAAGDYKLELKRSGYRSWQRDFTLEGGTVERFVYPFLFPKNLETTDVQLYASNPGLVTQSLDRRWVLIQQPGSFQSFDLLDVSSESAIATTLSLPAGIMETKAGNNTLSLVEWSTNNRHVLLKHSYDGGQEFVVVDIESPGASINVSRTIPGTFTDITLRDKKYDQYYLYNASTKQLHTANLANRTAIIYQTEVLSFRSHGNDVVIFITPAGATEGKVAVRVREGDQSYTIREISADSSYLVDVARFDNSWYYVVGATKEQRLYIFKNPVAAIKRNSAGRPIPVAVLRTANAPEFVSFSANARFIASQSGNELSVYDAETDRQHRYDIQLGLPAGQKLTWMDGHRLTAVTGDKTVVFDYDGTNKQTLNNAINGLQPMFDRDYEALFTLSPSVAVTGRPALTRTELRIEN